VSSDIIDSIDNALTDYAVGPDAMRWTTDLAANLRPSEIDMTAVAAIGEMVAGFFRGMQLLMSAVAAAGDALREFMARFPSRHPLKAANRHSYRPNFDLACTPVPTRTGGTSCLI